MKEYRVKKVNSPLTVEDERWETAEAVCLTERWNALFDKDYNTKARLLYTDEGLFLRMESEEWPLRVKATEENDEVCYDSCMEFFFTPNTKDAEYINLEANANAVPLCGIGKGREGRREIKASEEGIEVKTLIQFAEGWKLFAFIPFDFMKKHFSAVEKEMRANFYKCGEQTVIEHYSTWNKVDTPEPDYHRPEFFGKLILI